MSATRRLRSAASPPERPTRSGNTVGVPNTDWWGIGYKVESPLLSHYGATYKVYLGLTAV